MSENKKNKVQTGPYKPTLILHGGAGRIAWENLPPALYKQYENSLLSYVTETRKLLDDGANALTAAVHAVALMEEDPLFNCGRGSVFTEKGTIEMEASVMVTSVRPEAGTSPAEVNGGIPPEAFQKRAASVILVTQTRHPIKLAEQVLIHTAEQVGGVSRHCQLSGIEIEETGFKEWGLERKSKEWFWTKKRWEEHLRGLRKADGGSKGVLLDISTADEGLGDGYALPSQGTVGCVCLDSWGNIVAATSTGGLTNKKPGRVGDTPTVGAGFWAESWAEPAPIHPGHQHQYSSLRVRDELLGIFKADLWNITSCIPFLNTILGLEEKPNAVPQHQRLLAHEKPQLAYTMQQPSLACPNDRAPQFGSGHLPKSRRRAIGISGTGNGDSFLRVAAARTVGALSRFQGRPLNESLPLVAGALGELQQSAGNRWGTGEGEGGMIAIELVDSRLEGEVVWDFNCGGMWRAFWDEERDEGKVMVFKEAYEDH
ncbi:putative tpa: asparaginase [Phaeomoniella chlamydospora]|uniref:Putative tpa: asparaginase n=1 Tax=Phaeomoniella chlamydospora TaxID=158046 RepID=A0A0G2EB39_PHACM|nr:putative tpa: asparaginase [Phaeomoniella chlamydospora]